MLRLVAWNCRSKWSTNAAHLLTQHPDVAVVAECGPDLPAVSDEREHTWLTVSPTGNPRHLGVLARAPWHASRAEVVTPPWCLPVRVDGPVPFTLLATWTVAVPGWGSYDAQLAELVAVCRDLDGPVILAGDLNTPLPARRAAFRRVLDDFADAGLVDAFLHTRGLDVDSAFGGDAPAALAEPTFQDHRGPQHIDHVLVPASWASAVRLDIGSVAEWITTGRSDHAPLVLEYDGTSTHSCGSRNNASS